MIETSTLLTFIGAVLLLFSSPGPNMFFVLSHGISYGSRGGVAAALGIVIADLILTFLTASGMTALVAASSVLLEIVRFMGALYLLWLAWNQWNTTKVVQFQAGAVLPQTEIMRRAMLNSLLNPKALLFFLLFLPQFTNTSRGGVGWQLLTLGLVLTTLSLGFHGLLGAFSGQIGQWINANPRVSQLQGKFLAVIMVALAVRLLFLQLH